MTLRVFVSVGTDHHPFDRLIDWVDSWTGGRSDVELFVQHGSSRRSTVGANQALMGQADLLARYDWADIAVTQVGPGTIADANKAGLRPLVVPRDPGLGEVVDGHQFEFGAFMADRNRCWIATEEAEFRALLDRLSQDPGSRRAAPSVDRIDVAANVDSVVAEILSRPTRRANSLRDALRVLRARSGG